jgi:hypothetical protein
MEGTSTSSSSDEEEDGLFSGFCFYLDSDVDERVRELLETKGGKLVSSLEKPLPENFMRIINQQDEIYLAREACTEYQVVYQNWVNVCVLQRVFFDVSSFVACEPPSVTRSREKRKLQQENSAPSKRGKPAPYTKKEDDILREFATRYAKDEQIDTQELLWGFAVKKKILPQRTAVSMQKRYAALKKGECLLPRIGEHFKPGEDLALLNWDWCWRNMDRLNNEIPSKWHAAVEHNVVHRRKADALQSRYKTLIKEKGGLERAMASVRPNMVCDEMWFKFFKPKTGEKSSVV